jgi:hypothetical protein
MPDTTVLLQGGALLVTAAMFGGMLFFAIVVAPTVFRALPEDQAAALIRAIFPVYYLVMAAAGLIAALLAVQSHREEAGLLALVALFFGFMRKFALPRINFLRDAMKKGVPGAEQHFKGLHRASVMVHLLQMLALAWVLLVLAG